MALAADGKLDKLKKVDQNSEGNVILTVGADGKLRQPSPSGGSLDCDVFQHSPSFETPGENPPLGSDQLVEGSYYWLMCTADGEVVVARLYLHEPGVTAIGADELARRATGQLAILYPEPQTSPGITIDQIVGIDTWMWLDAAAWEPVTATAAIPGLSVSATATPQQVRWVMGDGTTVECDGPGTPYDPDSAPADQSSDCTHTYQDLGAYTASATVVWSVEWTATDGSSGALADVSRTTQFPMTAVDRQAIGR